MMKRMTAIGPRVAGRISAGLALMAFGGVLVFGGTAGCALYRNDKCYVEDDDYELVKAIFIESGSLEIVQKQMDWLEWRRCQKNEVMYRLGKEFEVAEGDAAAAVNGVEGGE